MKKDYVIMSDNMGDLPQSYYEEHQIPIMYLSYTMEGERSTAACEKALCRRPRKSRQMKRENTFSSSCDPEKMSCVCRFLPV